MADTSIVVEFKSPEDAPTTPPPGEEGSEGNDITLEQGEEILDVTTGYSPCVEHLVKCEIFAYPSPGDLEYTLKPLVDHAEILPDVEVIEETKRETVNIRNTNEVDLSGKGIVELISASWSGSVYDVEGNIVQDPPTYGSGEMTYNDGLLSWGQELIGTLNINYDCQYNKHICVIQPAPESNPYDPESYEINVTAFYSGGNETISLSFSFDCDTPDDDDDDDDDEPPAECYELRITYHKCTGELISEEVVRVPCPEQNQDDNG